MGGIVDLDAQIEELEDQAQAKEEEHGLGQPLVKAGRQGLGEARMASKMGRHQQARQAQNGP